MYQQHEHDTYKDIGKGPPLKCCKKIRAHLVFDVNHDEINRESTFADGNLTYVSLSSLCSGVASLRGIILALFLAEFNGLESWVNDIVNSCLESFTK